MFNKKQNKFSTKNGITKGLAKKKKKFSHETNVPTKDKFTEKGLLSEIEKSGILKKKNKPMNREKLNEDQRIKVLKGMSSEGKIKKKNKFSKKGNPFILVKRKMPSETNPIEKKNFKESKLNQNSQFEVNFPRGKKQKVFKDELNISSDKKKESIVNIFDQSTMQQHHEEKTHEKRGKNKFNPINRQHNKLDKKSIKKKRNHNPKQKKFQQFPNKISMKEARLGLNSMLTDVRDNSANDSEKNVDQIAADFKNLVQRKMVSQDNAIKFKKLQHNKKISDQVEMLEKLAKKQIISLKKSGKELKKNNVENKISLVPKRKISKLKNELESKSRSRTNELDSHIEDSNKGNIIYTENKVLLKTKKNNRKVKKNKSSTAGVLGKSDTDERLMRTLFIGNLPLHVDHNRLKKLFAPYGVVESARIRCSVPEKPSLTKKISNITKKYHNDVHSLRGYVVFKTTEGAKCGLLLNGEDVDDHHIRVDYAIQPKKYDDERSVFVGNLPFDVEEEALWAKFSDCGDIEGVRAIRDNATGVGKGFGYVTFKESKSVDAAIKMDGKEIAGRKARVKPVEYGNKKKKLPKNVFQKNTFRSGAIRDKRLLKGSTRKSIKKLIKKRQMLHQKKKISSLFNIKKKVKVDK